MEAADPVAEEEAAPADHSRNAVIKSLPVQLKSSSSPPLPQLELSSPPPTKLALISSLPLPQPAVSSQQLGSPSAPDVLPSPHLPSLLPDSEASSLQIRLSPKLCKASPRLLGASPEPSGASLEPLAAVPAQQVCLSEQLQPSPGQRGRSGPSGSPPAAVKGHPTPKMGFSAQLTDMLDSLDPSGAPEQGSFPGLSFDAYDVLTSSDMDSEREDLMAERKAFDVDSEDEDLLTERKAFRAMLRSNRADSSHAPARSGVCDRSTPNVRASTSNGKAPRLGSISSTHGGGAVPSALERAKGSKPFVIPQPSRSDFMAFAARAKASGLGLGLLQQAPRAGAAATDPLAAAARASALRAEAESGALGREANATATALKTRADASALAEHEGPALVAAPAQQQEQRQHQSEKAQPASSELSDEDSLDSLLGDLAPFPNDDPLSFWQASGSSIWEEAHSLAAQTYEVDDDSDHMAAVEADDAAAGADVPAAVPSAAAVGADAGATAVVGAGAGVGCSDAAVTTDALASSNTDATQQHDQALLTSLYRSWQTEESDDDVQLGHDSSLVSTLHQAESQNRAEEDQGEGGAAEEEEDNAEEEALEEGEVREEEGGGWVTGMPDGELANTSPHYTGWLAGSMLNRLEGDANDRGGQMGTLGKNPQ